MTSAVDFIALEGALGGFSRRLQTYWLFLVFHFAFCLGALNFPGLYFLFLNFF